MTAETCTTGRRRLLRGAGVLGALGVAALRPAMASPAATSASLHFSDEFAGAKPTTQIDLQIAAIADNGAVVPVIVSSSLPGTQEMIIVVEGNPQPVAMRLTIPTGTEPYVATRIKMAGSGTVFALARTADGLFAAARSVQVSVGGCG